MLKFLLFALVAFVPRVLYAQVSIGKTATVPHPSAMLDVSSNNKGFLPPQMIIDSLLAIENPAKGLMIFNLTGNRPVYYNGSRWMNFDNTPVLNIGDDFQGGQIAYIDHTGRHGLVIAKVDQATVAYGCYNSVVATSLNAGTGLANTIALVNNCPETNTPAKICYDLTLNGYSDWYLPSSGDLIALCSNIKSLSFASGAVYWTSSMRANDNTRAYHFTTNISTGSTSCSSLHSPKTDVKKVRAVRNF